jgi:fatty acid-binding protein DegV
MLSIKPVIELRAGVVEETAKVRTRSKALRMLAAKASEDKIEHLAVLHGNAPDLDEFFDLLAPIFPRDEIITGLIGPVIGTHAGPASSASPTSRPRAEPRAHSATMTL